MNDQQETYILKSWFDTWVYANDHISFNVIQESNGCPVDVLNIPCKGDNYKVRGYWGKSFQEAEEYAKQVLAKWFN